MELFLYEGNKKRKAKEVICNQCGETFLCRLAWDQQYCSIKCQRESRRKRVELECENCGKTFCRSPSKSKNSRYGVCFCSRACKDFAQSLKGSCSVIRPDHYGTGTGINGYRRKALEAYPNKCFLCDYDTVAVLEVHHSDGDRSNNNLCNLVILCPTHHAEIERGLRKLLFA